MATDPRTIEGSPERAADRGDPGALQIPEPDGNSLAVPTVVQRVLWEHVQELLAMRRRWLEDKITGEQATAELKAMSEKRQAIMYGQATGYEAAAWNSPEQLGAHLVAKVVGGDQADAAARAFVEMFNEIAGDLRAHEEGRVTDEMTQAVLEDLVLRYTGYFLGVPPEVYAGEPS